MRKINLINIALVLILISFFIYNNYEDKNNLKKYEKALVGNFNNINNKILIEENKNLKELLNLKTTNLEAILVRGYFVDLYDEFVITKGKKGGLKNGYAVVNDKRLIGFVRNVNDNFANVELIENLDKKVSVKVGDSYGLLEMKNNKLIISGISANYLKINEKVYTSGLTTIPGNLYIGKIKKIAENDEIFKTVAYVDISDDYQEYKYLMVLKNDSDANFN